MRGTAPARCKARRPVRSPPEAAIGASKPRDGFIFWSARGAGSPPESARIEREIELGGAFSDERRARLMEIADRCPVHRTLVSEINIGTRPRT